MAATEKFCYGLIVCVLCAMFLSPLFAPEHRGNLVNAPALSAENEKSKMAGDTTDDQQSTVYIKVSDTNLGKNDESVTDIMAKKRYWEAENQAKKPVIMTMVYGDHNGVQVVVGMLIHYEPR